MSLGTIVVIILAALFFGGIIYLARAGSQETPQLSENASSPEHTEDVKAEEQHEKAAVENGVSQFHSHKKRRRAKKGHRQHA